MANGAAIPTVLLIANHDRRVIGFVLTTSVIVVIITGGAMPTRRGFIQQLAFVAPVPTRLTIRRSARVIIGTVYITDDIGTRFLMRFRFLRFLRFLRRFVERRFEFRSVGLNLRFRRFEIRFGCSEFAVGQIRQTTGQYCATQNSPVTAEY